MTDAAFVAALAADLKRDEGVRFKIYRDTEGKLTIGTGHNIEDRGITPATAELMLDEDITVALRDLDRCVPWWKAMPETARRGLANMCFNVGINRLLGFKKMLTALEDHNYNKAADEALDSKWASQVAGRAQRIAALFRRAANGV